MITEEKKNGLSEVISKIDKEFGKGSVMKLSEKPELELDLQPFCLECTGFVREHSAEQPKSSFRAFEIT